MKTNKLQKILIYTILGVSLIIISLNDYFLKNIPEFFSFGSELGNILSSLSLAYISSFIFYLVVVVLKENRDKKNIYSAVFYLTEMLLIRAFAVYEHTLEASKKNKDDYKRENITKEEFFDVCSTANLHTFPKNKEMGLPGNTVKARHCDFISKNCVAGVNIYAEKIFNYMPFLDSEYVKLINDLQKCVFYTNFAKVLPIFMPSDKINVRISEYMFEYFELARKLERYNNLILKKYVE